MLEELTVSNLVLVDHLVLHFSKGFNCLSGETGAGKSILIGALDLLRGSKGEADLIRRDAEEAQVSALFKIDQNTELKAWLKEHGLESEDDTLHVRRILRRNGKNSLFVQGQAISLKELAECMTFELDIHGQHEHQNLFDTHRQREMLDRFAKAQDKAQELYEQFSRLGALIKQRERLQENEKERAQRLDYLRFASEEIEAAKIQAGEDQNLQDERAKAQHAEKIYSGLHNSRTLLSASENGALSALYTLRHELQAIKQFDADLEKLSERVDGLYYEFEDVYDQLGNQEEACFFDPARLEELEERLALLHSLKKKYGPNLSDVTEFAQKAQEEIESLEHSDENLEVLNKKIKDAEKIVLDLAQNLSKIRKNAALQLQKEILSVLASLGMPHCIFEIEFKQKLSSSGTPVCGAWGFDDIEFLLSANPGEPARPLRFVASGGELSRVSLAIKSALAESERMGCLVFDEVDAGIGGAVALGVAEHLYRVSRHTQILTVTHLATLAIRADNHLKVEKKLGQDRTVTTLQAVEAEDRVAEIARMLAGDNQGDNSLAYARDLLARHHASYLLK